MKPQVVAPPPVVVPREKHYLETMPFNFQPECVDCPKEAKVIFRGSTYCRGCYNERRRCGTTA